MGGQAARGSGGVDGKSFTPGDGIASASRGSAARRIRARPGARAASFNSAIGVVPRAGAARGDSVANQGPAFEVDAGPIDLVHPRGGRKREDWHFRHAFFFLRFLVFYFL